jgi:hypothetical protein
MRGDGLLKLASRIAIDSGSGNGWNHPRSWCAICDILRREDELMTELMNHKRSTS